MGLLKSYESLWFLLSYAIPRVFNREFFTTTTWGRGGGGRGAPAARSFGLSGRASARRDLAAGGRAAREGGRASPGGGASPEGPRSGGPAPQRDLPAGTGT